MQPEQNQAGQVRETKLAIRADALFMAAQKLRAGVDTIAAFTSSPTAAVALAAEMVTVLAHDVDRERAEQRKINRAAGSSAVEQKAVSS